jgi:excinuclease ABC subunit A
LGGELVAAGSPEQVMQIDASVTGRFLSGKDTIEVPRKRRSGNEKCVTIKRARGNNLQDVTVEIPLGTFTVVTGVSGSGKSTVLQRKRSGAAAWRVSRHRKHRQSY